MFWKKSNNNSDSIQLFSIPDEVRSAFRVTPSSNAPLKATLAKKPIEILNISSGGFCCKKTDIEIRKNYLAEIVLPPENKKISGEVKILGNDEENHCRCQFLDLARDFEDLIHLYVLNRQKEERENKMNVFPKQGTGAH